MQQITTNSDLKVGKNYWLFHKTVYANGQRDTTGRIEKVTNLHGSNDKGEELNQFGNGGAWCHDSNNQALEKNYIFGPIETPMDLLEKVFEKEEKIIAV
jgi:hypothetical protein